MGQLAGNYVIFSDGSGNFIWHYFYWILLYLGFDYFYYFGFNWLITVFSSLIVKTR